MPSGNPYLIIPGTHSVGTKRLQKPSKIQVFTLEKHEWVWYDIGMSENDPNNVADATPENGKPHFREPIPAWRDTFIHFLFGTPGNESILLNFLNAVLESDGQPPAKSVVAKNPFNPQTFVTDKYTILDVKATDERGDIFAVEFQTS